MRVAVIGYGSIGRINAHGFDGLGHDVVVNDLDPDRTAAAPFRSRSKAWIRDNADLAVVLVPTPTASDGGDPSAVYDVVESIAGGRPEIMIRSTMPPGTTAELAERVHEPLVYVPEFHRDRSEPEDFFDRDRFVIAGPQPQRETVRDVLDVEGIDCETWIECDDYRTAEIAKEAHNAFFATKVSFANQMRLICEGAGADVETVMDAVVADGRNTSSHLDPTLGPYGGKCLPKDTEALAYFGDDVGAPTPLLSGTIATNHRARDRFKNRQIIGDWPNIEAVAADGEGE